MRSNTKKVPKGLGSSIQRNKILKNSKFLTNKNYLWDSKKQVSLLLLNWCKLSMIFMNQTKSFILWIFTNTTQKVIDSYTSWETFKSNYPQTWTKQHTTRHNYKFAHTIPVSNKTIENKANKNQLDICSIPNRPLLL